MNHSTLSEQVVKKKKGLIVSPWMDQLRDTISLTSWSLERLPEYIWLALILENSPNRIDGISKCIAVFREITVLCPEIASAKMSTILNSCESTQKTIYEIIQKHIEKNVLYPLTLVVDEGVSQTFFRFFNIPMLSVEERINKLQTVTKKYNVQDSHEATDLRYLALIPMILTGKLHCPSNSPVMDALLHYGTTDHSEEIMRMYRPSIRSTEGALSGMPGGDEGAFVRLFWTKMRCLTENVLHALIYEKGETKMDYHDFIEKTKEAFNYLNIENKERTATDDAFVVLTGSLAYALKTFDEVIEHDLSNTIIGRQSVRIIVEIYIMMKYLAESEATKPLIWSQYKSYGIGKYKLILLKMREGKGNSTTHVNEGLLDLIVNEPQLEEFTDIDLKYFDDVKIREKAIKVDEKDVLDIAYDYDSSFAHGLWGAIRESSMLCGDNVFYHFRPVADATLEQNLPDITPDCFSYLLKLISFIDERYAFPEWYTKYLEGLNK